MLISAYSYVSVNHIITSKHILYLKNRSNYIEQNKQVLKYKESSDSWIILNEIENVIKNKILNVGTPLKSWGITINRGVLTGLNEAFIIDEDTKNKLVEEDPKSAEIIRPILRGRDIEKYSYRFANLYLINVHNGIKEKGIEPVNIDNYPAIKEHLDKFLDKLKKRQDKGITCYNLRNCAYMEDFFEQKIIYPETTQNANFYLDSKGFFADKTCFIMKTDKAKYLLATLSSSLFEYAYKKIFSSIELGISGYQYNKHALVNLPILLPNKEQETIINNLVDKILSCNINDRSNIQNEININIAKLYGIDEKTRKKIRD